jgi:hypothetical protein
LGRIQVRAMSAITDRAGHLDGAELTLEQANRSLGGEAQCVPLRLQTPGPGPLRFSGAVTYFTVGDVVDAIWSRGHEPAAQSHHQPVWIL